MTAEILYVLLTVMDNKSCILLLTSEKWPKTGLNIVNHDINNGAALPAGWALIEEATNKKQKFLKEIFAEPNFKKFLAPEKQFVIPYVPTL